MMSHRTINKEYNIETKMKDSEYEMKYFWYAWVSLCVFSLKDPRVRNKS